MKITVDHIAHEYIWRSIASVVKATPKNDLIKEEIVMSVAESGVALGLLIHVFDETKKLDQISSTEKLILKWNKIFPGQGHVQIQRKLIHYDFRSKRSRFFSRPWPSTDLLADAERIWIDIVTPS